MRGWPSIARIMSHFVLLAEQAHFQEAPSIWRRQMTLRNLWNNYRLLPA